MADIAASAPASGSESSGSSSAQSTGTTVQSGAGTTGSRQSVQPESNPQGTTPSQNGEPPRERWESILDNARKKTRSEVEAELTARYAPYQEFEQDPYSAVMQWLEKAEKHSLYGPLVHKHYESRVQSRQPAQQAPEPQPDVPIVDERGYITGKAYSADRQREWNRWNATQQKAELDARFGPLEQRERERDEQAREQSLNQEASRNASAILTELRQQPHYKENEPAIRTILLAHPEWGSNVHRAYTHFMHTVILPKLSATEAQATLDSLTKQGEATTVAPGGTAVGRPNFHKLGFGGTAKWFSEHPEEAALMAQRR